MTAGEIGSYLKHEFYKDLDYFVIPMQGWKRKMWFDDTGLYWVMPSPNMPTPDTAMVYPGMCLLEGTNLSEGRGTTRPFEIFGAPFIGPEKLVKQLEAVDLEGVIFRPLHFEPTFQKYAGQLCGGAQIHVTKKERFKPFKTAVAVLKSVHDLYPDHFQWKQPPYEYESLRMPIDILAGSGKLRTDIGRGKNVDEMEAWWSEECNDFTDTTRMKYLLYE
jgi:uncharacterized protein YbbC (DUF1343 family)